MATIRIFATRQKELFSGPVTECDYKPQLIIYFHILLQEAREREREREREKDKMFLKHCIFNSTQWNKSETKLQLTSCKIINI